MWLQLKLIDADVVDASLGGELGLSAEFSGSVGEGPIVKAVGKFDGLKGLATIRAVWGVVEFSRTFQLMQEREIHHEWPLGTKGGGVSHE